MTVFDPARFEERGTTFEPNQLADGVVHVFVNGVHTLRDGRADGRAGGMVHAVMTARDRHGPDEGARLVRDARRRASRISPEPEPAAGEVVLDVELAGICGSDLHGYRGHPGPRVPPLVLGHEVVGQRRRRRVHGLSR